MMIIIALHCYDITLGMEKNKRDRELLEQGQQGTTGMSCLTRQDKSVLAKGGVEGKPLSCLRAYFGMKVRRKWTKPQELSRQLGALVP